MIIEAENELARIVADTLVEACRQRSLPVPRISTCDETGDATGGQILVGDPCKR